MVVWGRISAEDTGDLQMYEGAMTTSTSLGRQGLFQQDTVRTHSESGIIAWLVDTECVC